MCWIVGIFVVVFIGAVVMGVWAGLKGEPGETPNNKKKKYDLKNMHIIPAYDYGGECDRARLDHDYYTMKEMAKMVALDDISFSYVPRLYELKVMRELHEWYGIDLFRVRVSHPVCNGSEFVCTVCGEKLGVNLPDKCLFCSRIIDKDMVL